MHITEIKRNMSSSERREKLGKQVCMGIKTLYPGTQSESCSDTLGSLSSMFVRICTSPRSKDISERGKDVSTQQSSKNNEV